VLEKSGDLLLVVNNSGLVDGSRQIVKIGINASEDGQVLLPTCRLEMVLDVLIQPPASCRSPLGRRLQKRFMEDGTIAINEDRDVRVILLWTLISTSSWRGDFQTYNTLLVLGNLLAQCLDFSLVTNAQISLLIQIQLETGRLHFTFVNLFYKILDKAGRVSNSKVEL
jgi:hypothetical protein